MPGPTIKGDWKWSKAKYLAAKLVAEDTMPDSLKIKEIGISSAQFYRWVNHPSFQAQVDWLLEQMRSAIYKRSIALIDRRIQSYIDDWEATQRIIRERGGNTPGAPRIGPNLAPGGATNVNPDADSDGSAVDYTPGYDGIVAHGGAGTGFIAKDYKGKEADQPVYSFDAALFKARMQLREQLAKELGQWKEKSEVSGPNGGAIAITITNEDVNL